MSTDIASKRFWTQKDIRLSKTAGSRTDYQLVRSWPPAKGAFLAENLARGLPVLRSAQDELGGADRDRTDDLRLAKPALSQLSYSPKRLEAHSR